MTGDDFRQMLALAAALLLLMPIAAAEEQQLQPIQFYAQWYFLIGTSQGECYANCVGACFPACGAAAAAANAVGSGCGSMCPSTCASKCPEYFATTVRANDGLPTAPATGCESQWQCKMTPRNPTYSPGDAREFTETDPSIPGFPSVEGSNTPAEAGITNNGEEVESNLPEAGVTLGENEVCPDYAPDGHPMRWYDYLGCQDIYWKNDYCALGGTCDTCTGRQGCIWNGAACVPCSAPSCSYSCIRGGAPVRAQQKQIAQPAPQTVQAAREALSQAQQTAGQQATAGKKSEEAVPAQPKINPQTGAASPQQGGQANAQQNQAAQTSAGQAQQTAGQQANQAQRQPVVPQKIECGIYQNCTACARAPNKDGENQCGWSEFLGVCIDGDEWKAVNASGLKAGWITEPKHCGKEEDIYCFKYSDCLSCAGIGGVKRRCQWSENDSKCVPYNPLSEFRVNGTSAANNIILPGLCQSYDCSDYAECGQCEQNAKCLWSKSKKECVEFNGNGEGAYFYPGNCPEKAGESAPQPLPSLASCPTGCTCDGQMRPVKCKGAAVNSTGLVPAERAAVNAGAGSQINQVDEIQFVQAGKSQTYVVRGRRFGSFLFVLPLDMNVTTTVDAKTGAIQKVEEPWWSFLAR